MWTGLTREEIRFLLSVGEKSTRNRQEKPVPTERRDPRRNRMAFEIAGEWVNLGKHTTFKLILFFIVCPLAGLFEFNYLAGDMATMIMVYVTAVAGALLLKRTGLQPIRRAANNLNRGYMPREADQQALLNIGAGLLLLLPGPVADLTGLLILLGRPRRGIKNIMVRKMRSWVMKQQNLI